MPLVAMRFPMILPRLLLASAALAGATSAQAGDLVGGVYRHAVDLPTSLYNGEGGVDLQLGYRFTPVRALGFIGAPAPYLIASLNTHGDTSFGGAGLGWSIGRGRVYVRPAIGLVFTGRTATRYETDRASRHYGERVDLGSPVLFEPELGLGYRLTPRVAIEASWVHTSHATLFSKQNPGVDMLGARLVLHLP